MSPPRRPRRRPLASSSARHASCTPPASSATRPPARKASKASGQNSANMPRPSRCALASAIEENWERRRRALSASSALRCALRPLPGTLTIGSHAHIRERLPGLVGLRPQQGGGARRMADGGDPCRLVGQAQAVEDGEDVGREQLPAVAAVRRTARGAVAPHVEGQRAGTPAGDKRGRPPAPSSGRAGPRRAP